MPNIIRLDARRRQVSPLDRLESLWNTSPANAATAERQRRSRERTEMLSRSEAYAAELARLQDWLGSYELPTPEEDA